MVVVLLGGLWALILLPDAWREQRYGSPQNTVDKFEQSMSMLDPARPLPGRHVMVLERPDRVARPEPPLRPPLVISSTPLPRQEEPSVPRRGGTGRSQPRRPRQSGADRGPSPQTLQRRRQVLGLLAATVVATGLAGLWLGGWAWGAFVLTYITLVGYLVMLVQLRVRREEARAKVHPLPAAAPISSGVRVHRASGA